MPDELDEELEIEISQRVGLLAAAFPSAQVQKNTIAVYVQMLKDISLITLDVVVEQCLAECKFFPTISEIRDKAILIPGQRPTPAEAWGQVLQQITRVGFYGKPFFADDLTARAVEIMDWRQLCTSENTVADRAHFMRIYEQLLNRETEDARLLPAAQNLRMISNLSKRMEMPRRLEENGEHGEGEAA